MRSGQKQCSARVRPPTGSNLTPPPSTRTWHQDLVSWTKFLIITKILTFLHTCWTGSRVLAVKSVRQVIGLSLKPSAVMASGGVPLFCRSESAEDPHKVTHPPHTRAAKAWRNSRRSIYVTTRSLYGQVKFWLLPFPGWAAGRSGDVLDSCSGCNLYVSQLHHA